MAEVTEQLPQEVKRIIEGHAMILMMSSIIECIERKDPGFGEEVANFFEARCSSLFTNNVLREQIVAVYRDVGRTISGLPSNSASPNGN